MTETVNEPAVSVYVAYVLSGAQLTVVFVLQNSHHHAESLNIEKLPFLKNSKFLGGRGRRDRGCTGGLKSLKFVP